MRLYYIIHTLMAQKGANAIKVISVTIGLLVSGLLFASLAYNHSYNKCFKDYRHLYQVWKTTYVGDEVWGPTTGTVGKFAGGVIEEFGDGVIATTFSSFTPLVLPDMNFTGSMMVCDSLFFETMGIEVLSGVPMRDLALPGTVYLSHDTAKKIFGNADPIGQQLVYGNNEVSLTVRGVFADLPANVTIERMEAVMSLPTAMQLGYSRWYDWNGNDAWQTCIRFPEGYKVDIDEIDAKLNVMSQRHAPDTNSWKVRYTLAPIQDTYLRYESVRNRNMVMWVLGIALLLMTTLNYVLITIASLSRRAKGIGVHKCSGATNLSIVALFIGETAVILGIAVVLMGALLFLCEPLVEQLIGLTLAQILAPAQLVAMGCGVLFFFLVGGLLPAALFVKIPVTQVFRRFTDRNSAWKKSLLFIQLSGVAFVGGLLAVLSGQYSELVNHDMGFETKNRAVIDIPDVEIVKGEALLAALKSLPYVGKIGSGMMLPTGGYSGQGIHADDNSDEYNLLFLSRLTWCHEDYYDVMGISLVKGRLPHADDEVVVSEEFVRQMHWGDEALGQVFGRKTFGQPLKVVGVSSDYMLRGFVYEMRPILHLYESAAFSGYGIMELAEPFDENYLRLGKFLADNFPNGKFKLTTLDATTREIYQELNITRRSALVAAFALIVIALMGLVGFTTDEVERRRKEIAIRKVNGATAGSVLALVCADMLRISVPAVVVGSALAWYVGKEWISDFTLLVEHMPAYCILSAFVILLFVVVCVVSVTLKVANENPVTQLKSE